jgi:hypothetical protein
MGSTLLRTAATTPTILRGDNTAFKFTTVTTRNLTILVSYDVVVLLVYTGCPRRNMPDFGRVFLMLKYTDITQNTYVQS